MNECKYCGKKGDLRPYGINMAMICRDCGMSPENIEATRDAQGGVFTFDDFTIAHEYLRGTIDIDNIEIEGEKEIAKMDLEEVSELIGRVAKRYKESNDTMERRKLKRDYLELVVWYNKETNLQAFKINI